MARYKTFLADGSVPNGRLYAGDLNGIQDFLARQADFTQTIDTGTLRVGDSGLILSKFGTGEVSLSANFRVTGLLRGAKGVEHTPMTSAARDALPTADRLNGTVIMNSTTNKLQVNTGTGASPTWVDLH